MRDRPPTAASTLGELDGWWLAFRCPACDQGRWWPCRKMARDLGAHRALADIVARLICQRCRVRPDVVELIDNPQHDTVQYGFKAVKVRVLG